MRSAPFLLQNENHATVARLKNGSPFPPKKHPHKREEPVEGGAMVARFLYFIYFFIYKMPSKP